jgi:hypothetical protein
MSRQRNVRAIRASATRGSRVVFMVVASYGAAGVMLQSPVD